MDLLKYTYIPITVRYISHLITVNEVRMGKLRCHVGLIIIVVAVVSVCCW